MWQRVLKMLGVIKKSEADISGNNDVQHGRNSAVNADDQSAVSVTIDELIRLKSAVKGISLTSARVKNSSVNGAHASRFRGRGMDYQESRAYQPGDDVRSMDWRVTARAGHPYVKMYEEERERPVMLLIDLNPGMFFATRGAFKSVQAVRTAALIAWSAIANGDRIGALVFNGKHQELPPARGAKGALRLFKLMMKAATPEQGLESFQTSHRESHASADSENIGIESALKRCRRVVKPGSLIFILSDFYDVSEAVSGQLLRLRQHNDVVAIQLYDRIETTPPPAGAYGVSDGQNMAVIDTRDAEQRSMFTQWCAKHHDRLTDVLQQRAIPLLRLATDEDPVAALRRFLSKPGSRHSARAVKVAA